MVASGTGFADALAAGPIAARLDAPLLLALADRVPEATRNELERLDPDRIVVVGGDAALSDEVAATLAEVAPTERRAGDDRFATAAVLAADAETHTAWVAAGDDWPDALTAGPAAGGEGAPVLLTARDRLPEPTRARLERAAPERIVVVGGTAAVSEGVEAELAELASAGVRRLAGPDRFATAAAIAHATGSDATAVRLATGHGPADALGRAPIGGC